MPESSKGKSFASLQKAKFLKKQLGKINAMPQQATNAAGGAAGSGGGGKLMNRRASLGGGRAMSMDSRSELLTPAEREQLKLIQLYQRCRPEITNLLLYDYKKVVRVLRKRPHMRNERDVRTAYSQLRQLRAFEKVSEYVLGELIANMAIDEFEARSGFGELALISDKPRSATVVTIAKTFLAHIEKDVYTRIMKLQYSQELQEKAKFLHGVAPFDSWSENAVRAVSETITWKSYQEGDLIISEGSPTTFTYLVKEGIVDLYRRFDFANGTSAQVKVGEAHQFDYFGEDLVLLDQRSRQLREAGASSAGSSRPGSAMLSSGGAGTGAAAGATSSGGGGGGLLVPPSAAGAKRPSTTSPSPKPTRRPRSKPGRGGRSPSNAATTPTPASADASGGIEYRSTLTAKARVGSRPGGPIILGNVKLEDARAQLATGLQLRTDIYSHTMDELEALAEQQREQKQWERKRIQILDSIARTKTDNPRASWVDYLVDRRQRLFSNASATASTPSGSKSSKGAGSKGTVTATASAHKVLFSDPFTEAAIAMAKSNPTAEARALLDNRPRGKL
ncbi:hypothetical protein H9P43_003757 [Blastocladiella emersonii ATCC 22665]|nr:hypothetical protein H9P43_003757 [Blastocladiella emersonii ATCC 22665]